jgi:hypothetical protein
MGGMASGYSEVAEKSISPFMTIQWPGKVKSSHGLQPATAAKK